MNSLDLHIHTTASDGTDTPEALLEQLKNAGITVFSVTDHDTIEGALEMEGLVPEGMTYLRGIEFSCVSRAGKCHILGYGFDPRDPVFQAALEEGRVLRREKLQRRIDHLKERFGVCLTEAELHWLRSRKSPGRPHLARLLVDRGLAADIGSAIRAYLSHVPGRDRIEAQTAVNAILHAGGIPVWAHPLGGEGEKQLTQAQFEAQLSTLLRYGIRGLECWYSRYTPAQAEQLTARAKELGLLVSGGSDYHGTGKPDLHLGQLNTEGTAPRGIDLIQIV